MDASNWIAILSITISVIILVITYLQKKNDKNSDTISKINHTNFKDHIETVKELTKKNTSDIENLKEKMVEVNTSHTYIRRDIEEIAKNLDKAKRQSESIVRDIAELNKALGQLHTATIEQQKVQSEQRELLKEFLQILKTK